MANKFFGSRQSDSRQGRCLALLGALCRPSLSPAHQARLRRWVSAPDWTPLSLPPAAAPLRPLLRHHIIRAGFEPRSVFRFDGGSRPLRAAELVIADAQRRRVLAGLLRGFHQHGVERVLLLKGIALAPLYPSPALRVMADIDLAVAPRDTDAVRAALRAAGCRPAVFESAQVWRHPSGVLLDVHVARSAFARSALMRAEPYPAYRSEIALIPKAADHLALLAVHAAVDAGQNLWSVVTDAQLLLSMRPDGDVAEESLALAASSDLGAAVAALFRFMNRHALPAKPLPESPFSPKTPGSWNDTTRRQCRGLVALYQAVGAELASPAALNLLRFTLRSPGEWLASLRARIGPGAARGTDSFWAERDPVLGDLPARGTWARQALKLRLVGSLLMSGRRRRYMRILRLQRAAVSVSAKPFDSLAQPTRET